MRNVLRPHFTNNLRKDVGDGMCSILVDESTDIITANLLIQPQFNTVKQMTALFQLSFQKLVELQHWTAGGIAAITKQSLADFNLDVRNVQGIGTDNASVMVGINNVSYQMLKREVPHLILVKCVRHSVPLAPSAATIECHFHVNEAYNWFSRLSTRQAVYREIFRTLNKGEELLRIFLACDTRWLSIEPAVARITTS
jgi:hypothetical protein